MSAQRFTVTYRFNNREYHRLEEMPAHIRAAFEDFEEHGKTLTTYEINGRVYRSLAEMSPTLRQHVEAAEGGEGADADTMEDGGIEIHKQVAIHLGHPVTSGPLFKSKDEALEQAKTTALRYARTFMVSVVWVWVLRLFAASVVGGVIAYVLARYASVTSRGGW